ATPATRLRATLRRAADVELIGERLKAILRGTKVRNDKSDGLLDSIVASTSPPDAWRSVLDELAELAWLKVEDEATVTLPSTPKLDAAGFSHKEKVAVAR